MKKYALYHFIQFVKVIEIQILPNLYYQNPSTKKITKFQKFYLKLIKSYCMQLKNDYIIIYKIFKNHIYVINHFSPPPTHPMCRCVFSYKT